MLYMNPEDYFLKIPSDTESNQLYDQDYSEYVPSVGERILAMLETNVVPPIDPDTQFYDEAGDDDVDPQCDINSSFWDDVENNGATFVDKRSLELAHDTQTSSVEQLPTEDANAVKSPENAQKSETASEPATSE